MAPSAPPSRRDPARAAPGLPFCAAAATEAAPKYLESDLIAPLRTIGMGTSTSLKASFWQSTAEELDQLGDLDFVSIALNTGGGRVWRNGERTPTEVGALAMQPFEGARWRFEPKVTFVHIYVPFRLLGSVYESLYDRELAHDDLAMPAGVRDERLCRAARGVQSGLAALEPTQLILDSWALVLAETLVDRLRRRSEKRPLRSFGPLPARGIARVIDYIEAEIDRDLDLASLAGVAAMSVYHFARRFKETVGLSPHAYVLERRIRRAREMLHLGGRSLAQVAAACGFSSQAHFTAAFHRALGMPPGHYRRAVASAPIHPPTGELA